jgi:hypothetical protein
MKSGKLSMKLRLNKKTIARLNKNVMDEVYGGYWSKPFGTECVTDCGLSMPCCRQEEDGRVIN